MKRKSGPAPLKMTGRTVTPIALPDPPLLNVGGCHGPCFLRNVVQLETDPGIVGIGETTGGEGVTRAIELARPLVVLPEPTVKRGLRSDLSAVLAAILQSCPVSPLTG